MDQIYAALTATMGISSNQLFAMESPGRVLDEDTYIFDTGSIYSILEKPQPVLEAEFRLSDGLLDPDKLVGGPNGKLLSVQYEEALNLLVPNVVDMTQFTKDRQKIREWLLEEEEVALEGKRQKMSRMALYQTLNTRFEKAKAAWEKTKTERLATAEADPNQPQAMEAYSKWLANEAAVQEGLLDGLFADLVVRGYYHEVRTFLSLMDVSSVAELLEQTKAHMRNSSMSSLDETETVYPVEFQPTDWFKALSTDFKPQDLLMQPDFLQDQAVSLAQKLDDLEAQKAALEGSQTGDIASLQAQVDSAQQAYDKAQSAMIKQFTNAVIQGAQIAFEAYANANGGKTVSELADGVTDTDKQSLDKEAKGAMNKDPLTKEQWQEIAKLQNATIDAQQTLNSTSRALAYLQAAHAAAESTDAKAALVLLNSQIQQTQQQLQHLKAILASEGDANGGIVPDTMPPVGRWYDITAKFDNKLSSKTSSLDASSSHTSWSVDLLFGSAGGSSDKQASAFAQKMQSAASDLQIGFRATKVTIDRGGWFNPGILSQSKSMLKVEEGFTISPKEDPGSSGYLKAANTSVLPAYPVAFIVAKDVTIKFTLDQSAMSEANSYMQENSSVGGGFLCFSASHASSSTKRSQAYYFESKGTDITIKIPGPQILGWVLEYVPADESKAYPSSGIPDDALPEPPKQSSGNNAAGNNAVTNFEVDPAPTQDLGEAGYSEEEEAVVGQSLFTVPLPYPFKLSGSKVGSQWSQVTNSQWSQMLGKSGWVDKGYHFYSRMRSRGPAAGINTPSDLESEIIKGTAETHFSPAHPNRYRIDLNIVSSSNPNQRLYVVYDYAGGSSKAELVTLTWM